MEELVLLIFVPPARGGMSKVFLVLSVSDLKMKRRKKAPSPGKRSLMIEAMDFARFIAVLDTTYVVNSLFTLDKH